MTRHVDLPSSIHDLLHSPDCQGQVSGSRLLGALYKSVEHHERLLVRAKQETCDPLTREIGSDFPEPVLQAPYQGHADRPPELDPHQVDADDRRSSLSKVRNQSSTG